MKTESETVRTISINENLLLKKLERVS